MIGSGGCSQPCGALRAAAGTSLPSSDIRYNQVQMLSGSGCGSMGTSTTLVETVAAVATGLDVLGVITHEQFWRVLRVVGDEVMFVGGHICNKEEWMRTQQAGAASSPTDGAAASPRKGTRFWTTKYGIILGVV